MSASLKILDLQVLALRNAWKCRRADSGESTYRGMRLHACCKRLCMHVYCRLCERGRFILGLRHARLSQRPDATDLRRVGCRRGAEMKHARGIGELEVQGKGRGRIILGLRHVRLS